MPETPLDAARRQAEEALAAYDRCKGYEAYTYAFDCVRPLRALLDALPAEPETMPDTEAAWTVVQGDIHNRLSPGSSIRCNSSGAWVVGPAHRSYMEAKKDLPAEPVWDREAAPSQAYLDEEETDRLIETHQDEIEDWSSRRYRGGGA